ncbi:MAG TPA: DUF6350 family protein [Dermatophilaceae bacterium]|nr:DUF6350 family protein [Dermatophilaceae bacterium]
MKLLKRRAPTPTSGGPPTDPPALDGLPAWSRAVVGAVVAAAASAVLFCLPAVLTWLTSAYTVGSGGQAVQLGLAGWLLTHGVPLTIDHATVSMVPWLLTLVPLGTLLWASRWVVAALEQGRPNRLVWAAGLRRDVALSASAFVGAYGALAVAVALVSGPVGVVAHPLAAPVFPGVLAGVAYLFALYREFRDDLPEVAPGVALWWRESVPLRVRRSLRPAGRGVLLMWLAGLAVILVQMLLRWDQVGYLHGELQPGFFGGVLLVVAAIAYLPTAAVWGSAWLAGPGFTIGHSGSVSLTQADPGVIPLVPMFGAIPDQGPLPGWTWLALVVPVAVGAELARYALARLTRLASLRAKAITVGSAVTLTGLFLAVAGLLSSGSLGALRLSHLGVHPVWFPIAVTAEMLLGGSVVVAAQHLRPQVAGMADGRNTAGIDGQTGAGGHPHAATGTRTPEEPVGFGGRAPLRRD